MLRCRGNPTLVRIGRVHPNHYNGYPAGALAATVYTRSMWDKKSVDLLECLRASSAVLRAGFPD